MKNNFLDAILTLLIRLGAVALVGFCVWFVLSATTNALADKLFDRDPRIQTAQSEQSKTAGDWRTPLINFAIVGTVLATMFVIELFNYRRFKTEFLKVESLDGSIRFSPQSDHEFVRYWFGTPTIDLSGSQLDNLDLPRFS